MRDLVGLIVWMGADLFRSRTALEVEICVLRQQINVLRRTAPKKQTFSAVDRSTDVESIVRKMTPTTAHL
jgi:hypothetical protein